MKRSAFTLLEVLVVIGIVSAVGMFGVPLYSQFEFRQHLALAKNQIIQGLQRARANAMAGKNDTEWSFYVPQGVLFEGDEYSSDIVDDPQTEVYTMPQTVRMTGLTQVTYDKKGNPDQTGIITLSALNGDTDSIEVVLSIAPGSVDTTVGGNLVICYNNVTISITDAAWPSYQSRGATLGSCLGGGSSSSTAVASSSSSSAQSSSSSSSSSSGMGGTGNCASKYLVQSDNVIKTTAATSLTFLNIAALRQYGTNGPYINTYYCYSTDNGSNYNKMFQGNGNCSGNGNAYGLVVSTNGGESNTVSVSNNSKIVAKVRWKYQANAWLSVNDIFNSKDDTTRFVYLRTGDNPTSNPGYWSQPSLKNLLQSKNYLDAQGKVNIGQCELILASEGGTLGASADYNDAVIKLTFQ